MEREENNVLEKAQQEKQENKKNLMISERELVCELGANELGSLSDIHGEGVWNRAVIDDCILCAQNLISSFFIIPTNPTPLLKDICTKLSIVELKRRNSYPKEELQEEKEECLDWLKKMANGKIPTSLESKDGIRLKIRGFVHKNKSFIRE